MVMLEIIVARLEASSPAQFCRQRVAELITQAQVFGDALAVQAILVNSSGYYNHFAEVLRKPNGDSAGYWLFLMRGDGQHRTGGGKFSRTILGSVGLCENNRSHVWSLTATNRDNEILAHLVDPCNEAAPTSAIRHLQE